MFNKKHKKAKEDLKPEVNPNDDSDILDTSTVSNDSTF
jgi:hypothetical protein